LLSDQLGFGLSYLEYDEGLFLHLLKTYSSNLSCIK